VSKRVLFIDDQLKDWENVLRRELEPFGFDLKGEEDPSDALKAIASYHPDVVMLDIVFPSGYQGKPTLEKIKKKYPNLPVMMITSTMDKNEYKPEEYVLAEYRYSKAALAAGDFSDLAWQLDRLIERAKVKDAGNEDETGYLRYGFIVGKTKTMQKLVEMVEAVANQDYTVLITGESGTGKELVAQAIHKLSRRTDNPFVTVICAAMPRELLESELFGHEKGAFTGAVAKKRGKFEIAGNGTIFLDEIGEIPLDTQVKLLRFIQDKQFERVGGNEILTSKARIIAATNRDLKKLASEGRFREDLYFRLNVVSLHVPTLQERKDDIPLFFEHFIKKVNEQSQKKILPKFRDDVRKKFIAYPWPGNIRELENMISRAIALANDTILQVSSFPELTKETNEGYKLSSDVSEIVDRIYKRELAWSDVCKEFSAKGAMRKEVLLQTIDCWLKENQRRPYSEELADLLSVSPGNMRRILSEYKIKLTKVPS
jgi:DNA-binding NtrC family response regulator